MTANPRTIWLDHPTREALREYAWANRTTMGGVTTEAIKDVRDNPTAVSGLSETDCASTVQLSLAIDQQIWDDARDAASKGGVGSFTSLVRRRLRKLLIDEGYLK